MTDRKPDPQLQDKAALRWSRLEDERGACVVRQIQEYLGHANVETTMIYTHVVKDVRNPARSPLPLLGGSRHQE